MMLVVLFYFVLLIQFAYSIGCSAVNKDPNMEDSKMLLPLWSWEVC